MAPVWTAGLLAIALLDVPAVARDEKDREVGDAYRAGDESHWVLSQAEKQIGRSWSRYEGVVDLLGLRAHSFRGQVELVLETPGGLLEQRFAVDLWTDARGHPLSFILQTRASDVYARVEGVFAGGKVELKVRQGPSQSELTRDAPADVYLLANNFLSHLELVLSLDAPQKEGSRRYTFFSANTLAAFPFSVEHEEVLESGAAYRDSLGERLVLAENGRIERVEIPAQRVVCRRVAEAYTPFVLEPPPLAEPSTDLEREDVRIEEGGVSLAGTITRKKGSSGRQPSLFFISGSGGQDRDGVAAGIDLGTREILDHLTLEGFLVLRVDDRGVGESTGPLEDLDFADLVADARLAVSHLLGRSDVDPTRVALIGHSEGAMSAVLLADSLPEIAAVVLMAGPGRPAAALLTEQLLDARRKSGATPDELAELEAETAVFLLKVKEGKPLDAATLPPELAAFVPARAWLASHLHQDPLANLGKVRCPVLILQGERDVQVSAERDAPLMLAALKNAKNKDCELVVFPGLDHLFKRVSGETASELDYLKSRPVDPEFLETLSTWLRERLLGAR